MKSSKILTGALVLAVLIAGGSATLMAWRISALEGQIQTLNDEITWIRYFVEPGNSGWMINVDTNLLIDAAESSLLLRNTGYAYLRATNNIYTSTLMPIGAETPPNIGGIHTPYGDIHGETIHLETLQFTGLQCPACNKPFSINDEIVLIVIDIDENGIYCIPQHRTEAPR